MLRRTLSPAQFLALSFLAFIAAGTLLLLLPVSVPEGRTLSFVDALFTASSAVCVTGLIVVDTPAGFSTVGHVFILLLIQAGGLGYMTMSTAVGVMIGKRITLQERLTLQEALNVDSLEGLLRFAGTILKFTLALEAIGAAALAARWIPEFGLLRGSWLAVFHSVSAFNNAGFSLFSTNLMAYRDDLVVNLVVTTLIVVGGLGFLVLAELAPWRRREAPLSMHTRLVLAVSGLLIVLGTAAFYLLEANNPRTLGPLDAGPAWLASYFHAVSPRTAGFNTIDIGLLRPPTLFLLMVLMFIGASPGSTGGGIKTTTFAITVMALWATVRGAVQPTLFRRRVPLDQVSRAFFVALISFLTLNLVAGALLVVEGRELLPTLFETTSAFGTVGLSMGGGGMVSLAGHFGAGGKLLVALMMLIGRVGPLTLAVAVVRGRRPAQVRYPEGKVVIG